MNTWALSHYSLHFTKILLDHINCSLPFDNKLKAKNFKLFKDFKNNLTARGNVNRGGESKASVGGDGRSFERDDSKVWTSKTLLKEKELFTTEKGFSKKTKRSAFLNPKKTVYTQFQNAPNDKGNDKLQHLHLLRNTHSKQAKIPNASRSFSPSRQNNHHYPGTMRDFINDLPRTHRSEVHQNDDSSQKALPDGMQEVQEDAEDGFSERYESTGYLQCLKALDPQLLTSYAPTPPKHLTAFGPTIDHKSVLPFNIPSLFDRVCFGGGGGGGEGGWGGLLYVSWVVVVADVFIVVVGCCSEKLIVFHNYFLAL